MDNFDDAIAEAIANAALEGDNRRRAEEPIRNPPTAEPDHTAATIDQREKEDNPVVGFVKGAVKDWAEAPFTGTLGYMTTYPGNPSGWLTKGAKGIKAILPALKEAGWDMATWSDFGDGVQGPFAKANDVERELWKTLSYPENWKHLARGALMTARENMDEYLNRNTPGGIDR